MVLLAITTDTWIVTGLGFGIVLLLLFFLIYVMKFFGWTMQKIERPKKPKAESQEQKEPVEEKKTVIPDAPKPVQAMPEDDTAAIAMVLYLASRNTRHDAPTGMIRPQVRETAWNTKSIGMNNQVF